jgi:putative Holliday junction resolvase
MNRLLGIDYGNTRIGIALTDPLQIISSGFATLENNDESVNEIIKICRSKSVSSIVIGIPFDQSNGIGASAIKVLQFAQKLQSALIENNLNIRIYEQDERYTTRDAHQSMREIKTSRKKKTSVVDQIAAAGILKSFMESRYQKELDIGLYLSGLKNASV